MQATTRKRLIMFLLFCGGVYLFYPGFKSNLDPKNILKEEQGLEKQNPEASIKELMNRKSNATCGLKWVGENPLPFDHQGHFKIEVNSELKADKITLIGYRETQVDKLEKDQLLDLKVKQVNFNYSDERDFGIYKKRLRIQDKEGKDLCFSNVVTLSLKTLPNCSLRANKKVYRINDSIYICFIDPALEVGIYNIDFYGTLLTAKGSEDDITALLKAKKIEDRRFGNERVADLDDLPMNMKDGRDKMCWLFPSPQRVGKYKRHVYGIDGSKAENRICKSNIIEFEVAAKK